MKRELFLSAVVCLMGIAGVEVNAVAKAKAASEERNTLRFYNPASGELRVAMTGFALFDSSSVGIASASPRASSRKKPGIGVILSAAIPGTGEIYAGSWIKGAVFFVAEVALWVGYSKYHDNGQKWENQFETYADTYWDINKWKGEYIEGTDPYTHELPDTKTQQYYEMIGKYDQFMMGWKDWHRGGPDLTIRRNEYETMRHKSNEEFINASRCAMAALGNHLLSALDATWTIHRHNQKLQVHLDMGVSMVQSVSVQTLSLSMAW
jgi:hypothetical protein